MKYVFWNGDIREFGFGLWVFGEDGRSRSGDGAGSGCGNGGSSDGGLQVGEGGVGTLDKLAWWLLVVLEWLQVHQGDRGSPVS